MKTKVNDNVATLSEMYADMGWDLEERYDANTGITYGGACA